MNMHVTGSCHCGNISYEAEVEDDKVGICHCTDCQRFSGGAFRVSVPTQETSFKLKSGTMKEYIKTAESGGKRIQMFCPNCGSNILSTSVEDVGHRMFRLRVPSLDQRDQLVPKSRGWCRSAPAWIGDLDSMAQREKG
jgi:hypothetical protein